MNITLNIGLEVSKNYLPENVAEMKLQYEYVYEYVKERLEKTIGKPSYIGMAQSTTEPTMVVQYKNVEGTLFRLFDLATELKQDCIAYAVCDDNDAVIGGALVGKYAHEWNYGVFNPEYFITMHNSLPRVD